MIVTHLIILKISLTGLGVDTSDKMHGVTFPQNSNKIAIVILCGSDDGALMCEICSKYTVHNWHSVNAWNNDDMCNTFVVIFDCSTNPAKMT